jgi:hypothetical protein
MPTPDLPSPVNESAHQLLTIHTFKDLGMYRTHRSPPIWWLLSTRFHYLDMQMTSSLT